jgi:hypothetical protein
VAVLLADAAGQPPAAGRPGRCRGFWPRPRRTRCGHRPASGCPWWACPSDACPGDVVARAAARPACRVPGGREHGQSTPRVGDDDLGGALPTPVMVAEPVTGHRERGDHLVDAAIQGGGGAFQVPPGGQGPARPATHGGRRSGPAAPGAAGGAAGAACPWPAPPAPWGRARRRPGRPASPGPRHPGRQWRPRPCLLPASSSVFGPAGTRRCGPGRGRLRWRVRSRSWRMAGGGTKLPRSSPCSSSSAGQAASPTSVTGPPLLGRRLPEVFVVRLGEGWSAGQRRSPFEGQQDTAALQPPEGFRPAIEARATSASQ